MVEVVKHLESVPVEKARRFERARKKEEKSYSITAEPKT
jgi:hypothetical protein